MPIRNSYGDPNIAKAFDNLATMFKPPTGTEMYGYAHAASAQAEMARKKQAFDNINSGNGTVADYAAAGIASPATQYGVAKMFEQSQRPGARPEDNDAGSYAVHGNANNTFEGQGRKLKSDERNKLIEERTKVVVAGMSPVDRNAIRHVPPTAVPILGYDPPAATAAPAPDPYAGIDPSKPSGIASLYAAGGGAPAADPVATPVEAPATPANSGIGSMFGPSPASLASKPPVMVPPPRAGMTQEGVMEVKPGERIVKPDGSVLEGSDKPQTLDQAKANELNALRKSGVIDDKTMSAIIFGTTPIESVVTPNGVRNTLRPDAVGQEPAPDDKMKISEIGQLQKERDALTAANPNDPKIKEYNLRIQALGRGQQQDKYSQVNDEELAKTNEALFKNGQTAAGNIATLNRIQQLLAEGNKDQGKWASLRVDVRKALAQLGVDTGDTSPMEVAQGLANKFALQLRDPSSGAGMPGSLSDSDREFLKSMSTSIDNSPEANAKIIDFYKKMNERTVELERQRRAYVAQHGRIDEGFRNQISDYSVKSPVFGPLFGAETPPAATAAIPAAPPVAPAAPAAGAPKRLVYNPATGELE